MRKVTSLEKCTLAPMGRVIARVLGAGAGVGVLRGTAGLSAMLGTRTESPGALPVTPRLV